MDHLKEVPLLESLLDFQKDVLYSILVCACARCQFENDDQLQLALEAEWNRLSQILLTGVSMNGDVLTVEAVVKNNREHIEHLFQ